MSLSMYCKTGHNKNPCACFRITYQIMDRFMKTGVKAPLSLPWQRLRLRFEQYLFIISLCALATMSDVKLKGGHKAASQTAPHCTHTALLSFSPGGMFSCWGPDECLVCCRCPSWHHHKGYKCFPVPRLIQTFIHFDSLTNFMPLLSRPSLQPAKAHGLSSRGGGHTGHALYQLRSHLELSIN